MFIDPSDESSKILDLCHRIKLKWILKCGNSNQTENTITSFMSHIAETKFLEKYDLKLYKVNTIDIPKTYDNISYVIETSGTTGKNKIVNVTHDCIMCNINSFR